MAKVDDSVCTAPMTEVADATLRRYEAALPAAGKLQQDASIRHWNRRTGPLRIVAYLLLLVIVLFATPSLALQVGERPVTPRGALNTDERRTVDMFRRVLPSVVHIRTIEVGQRPYARRAVEVSRGSGTGFVWDEAGHIVTNFHVIAAGNGAIVTLSDQSSWRAELVGFSAQRDLAVLRIRPGSNHPLRPFPLGTSRDLLVGQHVFAVGNPYGLDQSISSGVVSAVGREIPIDVGWTMPGMIQTDAAINPGNSGGPLLDSAGRLVGVNTVIFSPSGSSIGIGFAIPVDEVARIVPRLIRDGRFLRASLGAAIYR